MVDTWNHKIVAALDFGRTYSGYAFSTRFQFEREPLEIHCDHEWHAGARTILEWRIPTCILLDKEKQFVAFGYDAKSRYAELVMNEEQDAYYFFDRFTMSLHNNENVTRDMVLKDKTGKQCSAVEVFTLSIKYVVDHFIEELKRIYPKLGDYEIVLVTLWVVTVSAAWTDSAKQLMRASAEKAGINPEKLLLVNEPEAAFTYCHYLPTTKLQGSKPGYMIKEPGTKSMVVDLGGVTADITVLRSTYNGQLKVLCSVTENDCGGASVDDRFCKMLEEIVGGNVITELKRQDSADWLDMLQQFRIQIQILKTSNTKVIKFRCPCFLNEICEELHGHDLKSAIESSSYVNEITLFGDRFKFKPDLMIKLLTPTIDNVITFMKNTISNRSMNGVSNNVSNILMVGGFSECHMIQEAVYKAFPDNQIIIPDYPGLSVVKGAVLFGHRQDYNRSELCDEEGIGK